MKKISLILLMSLTLLSISLVSAEGTNSTQSSFMVTLINVVSSNNPVMGLIMLASNLYNENQILKWEIEGYKKNYEPKHSCGGGSSSTESVSVQVKTIPVEVPERICQRADFNKDGQVNVGDLGLLGGNCYDTTNKEGCSDYDLNNDGSVNQRDTDIFKGCYNVSI